MGDFDFDPRDGRKLLRFARTFGGLLRVFGVDLPDKDELDGLLKTLDEIVDMRDSFNEMFASRGWVAHDWVDFDRCTAALAAARAADFDAADREMVGAYEPGTVEFHLRQMRHLSCFGKRDELARLALEDYEAGRFHACIPVVLALLDGMGQQLLGYGFFKAGVNLASDASFLEIGPGLTALIRAMTVSRGGTKSEVLTMPLRHGIVHGVDLGYANKLVAAKAWGALIAAGSYAQLVENPPPPPEPEVGLLDAIKDLMVAMKNGEVKKRAIESWSARDMDAIHARLRGGGIDRNSPEEAAHALLAAWVVGNYGTIASLSNDSLKENVNHLAGRVRTNLTATPSTFTIQSVDDESPVLSVVTVCVKFSGDHYEEMQLRMCHFVDSIWAHRALPNGSWLAVSLWPLEAACLGLGVARQSNGE